MRIRIACRDGAGRCGDLEIKDRMVSIPNIIYLHSKRFPSPDFAEIVGTLDGRGKEGKVTIDFSPFSERIIYPASMPPSFHRLIEEGDLCIIPSNLEGEIPDIRLRRRIFILANLVSIYERSRIFVKNLVEARERVGYNSILYAPGVADAKNLSLLIYLGVDFVDSTKALVSARKGMLFFPEGNVSVEDAGKICSCPICEKFEDPEDMGFEDILLHNLLMLRREMDRIRFFISKGRLRELVETRVSNSPELLEKFRILNDEFYGFLEERTPIIKKERLMACLRESLDYPEIKRFRKRVIEWYEKPRCTKILVLLPCSARKPYSQSKSHRMFKSSIKGCGNTNVIHEMIVTSPLGIVPRELEMIYPANLYDIPVTGRWFGDELEMIKDMLARYIKRNRYDMILSHLPDDLSALVEEVLGEVVVTCKGNPTSRESLENLRRNLKEMVSGYEHVSREERLIDDLRSISSYQFGREVAEKLIMDGCEVKGKYPSLRVFWDGKQICSLSKERGLISLSLEGGRILFSENRNIVEIEDVDIKGSVLAPCVKRADPCIRIEDEVVIKREGRFYGVGIARMNGREMVDLEYGEAVRLRHHL